MLRLILRALNTDIDSEYNFAYVDLDEAYVKELLHKMDVAAEFKVHEDDMLFAIQTWDCSAVYCSMPTKGFEALYGDIWAGHFELYEWGFVPETFVIQKYEEQRTEMDLLNVTPSDLWWTATPRHQELEICTSRVTRNMLEDSLERLRGNHLKGKGSVEKRVKR